MRAVASILLFTPLLGCFFLSGASALIYEVVWTRQLSLVFGVTLYAISAVLASFMAGLALGSALAGSFADRLRWPALFYALCEIGIALAGVVSPQAIKQLTPIYVWLNDTAGDGAPIGLARFAAACVIMLVPTALMGATLPFMVKASLQLLSKVGYNVSLLYALNTGGAALGTLLAGFYLIGGLGFQGSVYVAAVLNLAAGLLALAVAPLTQVVQRWRTDSPSSTVQSPKGAEALAVPALATAGSEDGPRPDVQGLNNADVSPAPQFPTAALNGLMDHLSAATADAPVEVATALPTTSRLLPTGDGQSGDRLPSSFRLLPSADGRRGEPLPSAAHLLPSGEEPGAGVATGWILGVAAVSGFCALAYEVIWFRVLDIFLNGTAYAFSIMLVTFLGGLAIGSALISLVMPQRWNWAFVLGILEVLIGLEAAFSLYAVGEVPAWRDALTAAIRLPGFSDRPVLSMTVVAALILLPLTILLGMTFPVAAQAVSQGRQKVGALVGGLNAANTVGAILGSLAGGFWIVPLWGSQRGLTFLAAVNIGAGLALCWLALYRLPRLRWAFPAAALALFYPVEAPDMMDNLLKGLFKGHEVLWYEEGLENTVSIQRHPQGYQIMYLNSRDQAFDAPGMAKYHQLLGHLPMLLHPDPADVLVIGLGGGATPGAVSRYQDASIDVVELSPSVVLGAQFFSHINNAVHQQPNVNLVVDDGRNYLLLNKKKYDVITADIIQAHHAGSGNLYSREYYELAIKTLKDDGIMIQWVNTGQTTLYPLIVRTFLSVFPEATIWGYGTILVGSKQPQHHTAATLAQRLGMPGVRAASEPSELVTPEAILGLYSADGDSFRRAIGDGPILTDDRPLTEYFRSAPGDQFQPAQAGPLP